MDNVLVTGASRGLGLGMARRLAGAGFRVIAVARKMNEEFEAAVAEQTGELHFAACDLGEVAGLAGFVKSLRTRFGPLYGLVNNAGIGTGGVLATMPNADIERLVRVNTLAPLTLTKYAMRGMMSAGRGRIVNVTSIIASTGYSGLSVYGATKASMVGFTHSLAREVGRLGITVNAVAPGFIATRMTEGLTPEDRDRIVGRSALRRLAEVDDIANAVEFLMSDKARNITGTVLTVDAGNTA
jgi:3-oxoacyl-[acyl-carrier protein] reductase